MPYHLVMCLIAAQLTIAAMQNYQAEEGERFILDRVPFVVQAYEAIYDKLEEVDAKRTVDVMLL